MASETSSASHLAAVRCAAGTAAVAIAPTAGSAAVTVSRGNDMAQTALISRVAAISTAAPPNIETAYERAKPFWSRRSRPESPPNEAAVPLTDAVDQLVVDVDQAAGEVLAAAYQDDVVEVVLEQIAPGGPGEQLAARGDDRDRACARTGARRRRRR